MRVLTPGISWHNRERVSAVDFQPASKEGSGALRLATGGDDHHVVIWSIPSEENTDGKLLPHCLCDLSRHQNSVNVVRWAKDGSMLASGDTDSCVIVWQKQDGEAPPDIFGDDDGAGGGADGPKENWTTAKTLRGHLQDVTGLEFSPSGSHLVSCSIDNTAIVFDVNKGTKLKILSEHKGWVNGVAFDPAGKFVLTLASDRFLRVYNTKNYKVAHRTNKAKLPLPNISSTSSSSSEAAPEERSVRLFHDDTFKSFYRRLCFSPDGELVVVPSGVLDVEGEAATPHCTYVFARNNLTKPVLYLPNKEHSVAARFSPVKYKLRNLKPAPEASSSSPSEVPKPWERTKTLFALPYRMIYAVATQNTVVLYDTQQGEPFARISNIHYIGLTDVTWSPNGNMLFVSSTDGFCSVATFREGELGEVYSEDEENKSATTQNGAAEVKKDKAAEGEKEKKQALKETSVIAVKKKPAAAAKEATPIAVKKSPSEAKEATPIMVKKKPTAASTEAPAPEVEKPATPIAVKKKPTEAKEATPIMVKKKPSEPKVATPIAVKKKPSSSSASSEAMDTS